MCMGDINNSACSPSGVTKREATRLTAERQVLDDEKDRQRQRSLAKRRAKAALHGKETADDELVDSKRQDSDTTLAAAKQFIMWRTECEAIGPSTWFKRTCAVVPSLGHISLTNSLQKSRIVFAARRVNKHWRGSP